MENRFDTLPEVESTRDGKPVARYTLKNCHGMEVVVTNFGCRIVALRFPDGNGTLRDVVQGFDCLEAYYPENHQSDFGAVIGRYANRLAGGRIEVGGICYQLPQNNGENCLHGGPVGWQYAVYDVVEYDRRHIVLTMTSPDGDNGFPGEVAVRVTYSLDERNALRIDYHATADRQTVINMTNHSYFNLNGDGNSSILNHRLQINADTYLPTDANQIPLGEKAPVEGTPLDFRKPHRVGDRIDADCEQLRIGCGYDHCWSLKNSGSLSASVATLCSEQSGIGFRLFSSAPGLQVYTGNYLDGVRGKGGIAYPRRSAICLETQCYPDSPNHHWPESSGTIGPDNPFDSTTVFQFFNGE